MKSILGIAWDYAFNALKSAVIGALVSAGIALAQGEGMLSLGFAASCALVGIVCGTSSKLIIEGAFMLFGPRRWIAYMLNAAVIAGIVIGYVLVFFGSFAGISPRAIVLAFFLPEAASVVLVRSELEEVIRLERAFDRRREELDESDSR
jgi:hypothetical protein